MLGCGKTSIALAIAEEKFAIYLECPANSTVTDAGYFLKQAVFSLQMITASCDKMEDYDEVRNRIYIEVMTRLYVLRDMKKRYPELTPLQWILFTMNDRMVAKSVRFNMDKEQDDDCMNMLLDDVVSLIGYKPLIIVDGVHLLAQKIIQVKNKPRSVMWCVMKALSIPSFPILWSGSRIGMEHKNQAVSAVCKAESHRSVRVLGDFTYMSEEAVWQCLSTMLSLHGVNATVRAHLSYILQGRPRFCATFVSMLVEKLRRGATMSDSLLLTHLSDFMEEMVIERFLNQVAHVKTLNVTDNDIGRMWYNLQLRGEYLQLALTDHANNTIAYTKSTIEYSSVVDDTTKFSCTYEYHYGEPPLLEAVNRYVTKHPDVGDAGVYALLQDNRHASTLGLALDLAVIMAVINRQKRVLKDICGQSASFQQFANCELALSRVVMINRTVDMLDWMTRVIANPDDRTFPLLLGVPVKNMIISPPTSAGADVVFVALQSANSTSSSALEYSDTGVSSWSSTSAAPVGLSTPVNTARSSTAASSGSPFLLREKDLHPSDQKDSTSQLVFFTVCCAIYKGAVNDSKHLDQLKKVKLSDQFQHDSRLSSKVKEHFRSLLDTASRPIHNVPVLVELPATRSTTASDVVMVTGSNAEMLFSQQTIEVLKSMKAENVDLKLKQKGKKETEFEVDF